MDAISIDLGRGVASVAGIEIAVAPGPGGSLVLDGATVRPLTHGERSTAMGWALSCPRPREAAVAAVRGAAVESTEPTESTVDDVSTDVVDVLALALAGADADGDGPGFAEGALLVVRATGWSAEALESTRATQVDLLARSLREPTADDGWTRLAFGPPRRGAAALAALRDTLADDLVSRARSRPTGSGAIEAGTLAQRPDTHLPPTPGTRQPDNRSGASTPRYDIRPAPASPATHRRPESAGECLPRAATEPGGSTTDSGIPATGTAPRAERRRAQEWTSEDLSRPDTAAAPGTRSGPPRATPEGDRPGPAHHGTTPGFHVPPPPVDRPLAAPGTHLHPARADRTPVQPSTHLHPAPADRPLVEPGVHRHSVPADRTPVQPGTHLHPVPPDRSLVEPGSRFPSTPAFDGRPALAGEPTPLSVHNGLDGAFPWWAPRNPTARPATIPHVDGDLAATLARLLHDEADLRGLAP